MAAAAALPYLGLNLVVFGREVWEVMTHPTLLADWRSALAAKGDASLLIVSALLAFLKLALGLSGFETGVSVMPLIDGRKVDRGCNPRAGDAPLGRGGTGESLPPVWRGRDRAYGPHDSPALLGLDAGRGRPASHSPDERLSQRTERGCRILIPSSRKLR